MLKPVLRLAFAASNNKASRFAEDASFTYRCANLGQELSAQGQAVWLGHVSGLPWRERWDAVVFHRPRDGLRLRWLTRWLARRGVRLVADFDDLVFNSSLARFSPGVVNGLVPLKDTERLFAAHAAAGLRFDQITVSTETLAEHARATFAGVPVAVVPNAVHRSWLPMAEPTAPSPGLAPVLSYLPGTRSHDQDFASVAAGVERALAQHPEARLCITGPLQHDMLRRCLQVQQQPRLPFVRFHEALQRVHLNLAPLERSPFNDCKSAVKVMEGAWWGVPTLCMHLPDALRFKGAGALVADSAADFGNMLTDLLAKPDHLAALRQGLRERVLLLADVRSVTAQWRLAVMGHAMPERA